MFCLETTPHIVTKLASTFAYQHAISDRPSLDPRGGWHDPEPPRRIPSGPHHLGLERQVRSPTRRPCQKRQQHHPVSLVLPHMPRSSSLALPVVHRWFVSGTRESRNECPLTQRHYPPTAMPSITDMKPPKPARRAPTPRSSSGTSKTAAPRSSWPTRRSASTPARPGATGVP